MRLPFSCPHCTAHYQIPSEYSGKSLSCAKCGKRFDIHFEEGAKSNAKPEGDSLFVPVDDATLLTGKLALKLNYLSREQLKTAIQRQQKLRAEGEQVLFGELLVREGFLTEVQRDYIVSVQGLKKIRKSDDLFAGIVTQNEFATNKQVDESFKSQKRLFNEDKISRSIAEILTEEGAITPQQRDCSIRVQEKIQEQINDKGLSIPIAELISKEGSISPEELAASPLEAEEAVKEEAVKEEATKEELIEESLPPPFTIKVSPDGIHATLVLGKAEGLPALESIIEEISTQGISYNRLPDERIDEFLQSSPAPEAEFEIAAGVAPGKSKNAEIEYKFDADPMKIGKMKEDGVIDFKDRGEIPQVRKDDLIAVKIPRERGENGTDVYGKKIESKKPDDIKLRCGKGAGLSSDKKSATANFDGKPIKTPSGIIDVLHSLQITGDVGIETGHIKFDGDVQVAGMVEKDFKVIAGSLTVNELDGGKVDIRGDLNVKGGIIDANVRVGGNLKAKYIRGSKVNVVGDAVIASEIMETDIEIGGSLLSERCKIYENNIGVGGDLTVLNIGSDVSNPDTITLASGGAYDAEKQELINSIKQQQQAIEKINDKMAALEQENSRLNEQIGEAAQRQDKAMVNKRDNPDDPAAEAEFVASEEAMNDLFTAQDKIVDETDALKAEIEPHNKEISHFEEEQEALKSLIEKERGSTQCIHAKGQIFEGTLIKGKRTKLTIDKAIHKVSIFEEQYTDKNGIDTWRMKVEGLKI